MASVSEQRTKKHMTASERRADLKDRATEMAAKGWTNGQIAYQLSLTETSVRSLLGQLQTR